MSGADHGQIKFYSVHMFSSSSENPRENEKRLIRNNSRKILHTRKKKDLKTKLSGSNCWKNQNTQKNEANPLSTNHKNIILPFRWRGFADFGIRFLTFHLHGWGRIDFVEGGAWAVRPNSPSWAFFKLHRCGRTCVP